MRMLIVHPNWYGAKYLDVTITSIATYVNSKTNHEVRIADLSFRGKNWKNYLTAKIESFNPDVISINTWSYLADFVKQLVKEIKNRYPLVPIMAIGWYATLRPNETINIDGIDVVVLGEVEETVTELLDIMGEKGNFAKLKGVKGTWIKQGGNIIKNRGRHFPKDLDDVPFLDWDLWEELDKYLFIKGTLYAIANWGGPYDYKFHSSPLINEEYQQKKEYMVRNPKKVVEEIKYQYEKYKKRGMKNISFLPDSAFTSNPNWLENFCKLYTKRKLNNLIPFAIFSRADNLDERKVRLLKRSGCFLIRIEVGSGDAFMRNKVYRKNVLDKDIKNAFLLCKKYGIPTAAYFVLGGPGESKETIKKTYKLIKTLNTPYTFLFTYRPLSDIKTNELMRNRSNDMNPKEAYIHKLRICLFYIYPRLIYAGIKKRGMCFFMEFPFCLLKTWWHTTISFKTMLSVYTSCKSLCCSKQNQANDIK